MKKCIIICFVLVSYLITTNLYSKASSNKNIITIPSTEEECTKYGARHSLHSAAAFGCTDRILELINSGEDINGYDERLLTPLANSVIFPSIKSAKFLLEHGADPNKRVGKEQETVLITASYRGLIEIVELLLEYGADPNIVDNSGNSALSGGVATDKLAIVKLLLKHGADLHGGKGVAPILSSKSVMMLDFLVSKGADMFSRYPSGDLMIYNVATQGNPDLLEKLIKAGMPKDKFNHKGYTPLMCAVGLNRLDNVKVLIKLGVNVNAKNDKGETALSLAKEYSYPEIIEYLKTHGAIEK